MDENTGTQLAFKNILLQYCDYTKLDDAHGYLMLRAPVKEPENILLTVK